MIACLVRILYLYKKIELNHSKTAFALLNTKMRERNRERENILFYAECQSTSRNTLDINRTITQHQPLFAETHALFRGYAYICRAPTVNHCVNA